MANLITYERRLIAGKMAIKNYKNMSRERLLSTLDESERNFKKYHKMDLSQLQKCRIFHKMNLSKSQKCRIYCKMN